MTLNLKKKTPHDDISNKNLEKGPLIVNSRVKVTRIFSVDKNLIRFNIGKIDKNTFSQIMTILSTLLK